MTLSGVAPVFTCSSWSPNHRWEPGRTSVGPFSISPSESSSGMKTFNAYGDNIYYSDPDRANLYLGGGATPKSEQSLAYLLRNDVLTNIENLTAELEYLLKSGESDVEDLYLYADVATGAMKKYLAIVPPNELEEAKKLL